MNIKKTIVALAIAMSVAFVASVGMASAALPVTVDLYAGQDILVGNVTVSVSDDGSNTINITYNTTGTGWEMNETHLHIGYSADPTEIPQTKKNNPIPGHFEYSAVHDPPVTVYTYATSISALVEDELFIAAHAEVSLLVDEVWQEESAWAGTEDEDGVVQMPFLGKNWATYFTVLVP